MATKKAGTTPVKKSAIKTPEVPKPAAKKAAVKTAAAAEVTPKKLPGKKKPPTHEEIAHVAHSYWEKRGRHGGSQAEDWLRAEKELNS